MLLKINKEALGETLRALGVHPASLPLLAAKAAVEPLKLLRVRTPAANIIKQEMLAAGGDAAVPAGCVTCAEKYVDIVLLGTRRHYALLAQKLAQMPYFGLAAIQAELAEILQERRLRTVLADGRSLTYEKLRIMGILNITPDSFYAGSRLHGTAALVQRAVAMLAAGADILDIGGESTRPGSAAVSAAEELARVVPAIAAVRRACPAAIISVDTYRAATAQAALQAGADIINDVSAMSADAAMPELVRTSGAPVILMHMRGTPKDMQQRCEYGNVAEEVAAYLYGRAQLLRERGVGAEKIILDPGIGFAKNTRQNLELLRSLPLLTSWDYPVLLAASRKKVIGDVLDGLPAEERLAGTIALSCQAVYAGAQLVRVHDVQENVRAVRMLEAVLCPQHT